jgi:chemotaxis protein MotB
LAHTSHLLFLLASAATFSACVSSDEYLRLRGEKEALQRQHDDLVRYQGEMQERQKDLLARLSSLQSNAVDADAVRRMQGELRDALGRLKGELDSNLKLQPIEGVRVVETAEGIGFQVQGNVLFDSGQAELKESGKETLKRLLPDLMKANKVVRVDGHTDTDPIARSRWRNNLQLSAERAGVVADFMVANGFPAKQLFVAGFGEFRPIDAATSEEAKRTNRRVEILIMK